MACVLLFVICREWFPLTSTKQSADINKISAILKVQRRQEADLRPVEQEALAKFVLGEQTESSATPQSPATSPKDMLAARKAARNKGMDSKYDPAIKYALLGSAAEVERLWTMAPKILTKERYSTSPFLFELMMCLKYNRDLWHLDDAVETNKRRKNNSRVNRAKLAADRERVDLRRAEIESWDALQGSGSE